MKRRHFLGASLASLGSLTLFSKTSVAQAPACGARTDDNIEGPFHRPGAPFRDALQPSGVRGITLMGAVLGRSCQPLAGAVLDVWQADADGDYDLAGFSQRGQLRTDASGQFRLTTIHPGRYRAGGLVRPSHIHVKVHANGHPPLTTQLYFPGDPHNDTDPWFRSSLLLTQRPRGCHPRPASYRFVFRL